MSVKQVAVSPLPDGVGDSASFDENLIVFSEDSPVSFSHLFVLFISPGNVLFGVDMVISFLAVFFIGLDDCVTEESAVLESVLTFVPFEEEIVFVVQ